MLIFYIPEVPLRAHVEYVAQASRGSEGLCICSKNIDVCGAPPWKLLVTTLCVAAMADGVASILSIRPNGPRSGLSDQLAQVVQSSSGGAKVHTGTSPSLHFRSLSLTHMYFVSISNAYITGI